MMPVPNARKIDTCGRRRLLQRDRLRGREIRDARVLGTPQRADMGSDPPAIHRLHAVSEGMHWVDGLRALSEVASPSPTHYALDQFHLLTRIRHVDQTAAHTLLTRSRSLILKVRTATANGMRGQGDVVVEQAA
jgi:hypothetical protein